MNFVKFTEWPAEVRPPTVPLVLGSADREVSPELERTVAGQKVEGHPLTAIHVSLESKLRDCALLYVGKIDRGRAAELTQALNGAAVLTVGGEQDFAAAGGMIGLFIEDGRMRFAVNIGAAERGRLRLSAKLLTLARIVKD